MKRLKTILTHKYTFKFVLFLMIFSAIFFISRSLDLGKYLDIDFLQNTIESFGVWAPLIYILIYIITTILMIPGTAITGAGGIVFGAVFGTLYTVIGATIGSIITFFIARLLGEDFVEKILKSKFHKLYEYDEKLEKNGFQYTLFMRLMPIFPYNFLNYGLGLTKLKFKDYITATFIGIIPGTFIIAYLGESIANLNVTDIIISTSLLVALSLSLPAYNYYKKRKEKKQETTINNQL